MSDLMMIRPSARLWRRWHYIKHWRTVRVFGTWTGDKYGARLLGFRCECCGKTLGDYRR